MGRTIGGYEVVGEIARGATSVVLRAHDPALRRDVAVKLLLDSAQSERAVAHFEREARALAKLRHPNIVSVIAAGHEQGQPFIVMDLVSGQTLAELLERQGPLPPREAVKLARKLALALDHAHAQGVLHRDIEPGNVLIDQDGEPRLTDFGLGKDDTSADAGQPALSVQGGVVGTPGYWSPEQARGELDRIGPRSDVFELGATLYAMLTGAPPFRGATVVELIAAMEKRPPPPSATRPEIDASLDALVLRCLEPDLNRRSADMGEVAHDLEAWLGSPTAPPTMPPPLRRRELPRSLVALLALLAGGAIGASAVALTQGGREPDRAAQERAEAALVKANAEVAALRSDIEVRLAELAREREARAAERSAGEDAADAAAQERAHTAAELARTRLELAALRGTTQAVRERLEVRVRGLPEAAREAARAALLAAAAGLPWAELAPAVEAAVAAAPGEAALHLLRARLALGRDEHAVAREALARARELGAPQDEVALREGEALWLLGDPAEAVRRWDDLAAASPSTTRGRLALAWACLARGDGPGCSAACDEVLRDDPDDTTALSLLASRSGGAAIDADVAPLEAARRAAERAIEVEGALTGRALAWRAASDVALVAARAGGAAKVPPGAFDAPMQALVDTFPITGTMTRVRAIRLVLRLELGPRWFERVPEWIAGCQAREPARGELDVYAGVHLLLAGRDAADVLACWARAREKTPRLRVPDEYLGLFRERFGEHSGLAPFSR